MADKKLNIKITTKGAQKSEKALGGVNKQMKSLAKQAVLAAGGFMALRKAFSFTVELKNFARDAEETTNKFKTVFSSMAKVATQTAKTLADSFGLAHTTAMELLGDTGDLLVGFGFTEKAALELSKNVNELAIDLASFTNFSGGAEGASLALTKALLGERESIKSLGIAITEADLKEFAADQGLVWQELDRVAKAQLTYELALKQSSKASGDFARTQEGLANQERILKERFKALKEELGVSLIPAFQSLTSIAMDAAETFSDWIKIPTSEKIREEKLEFDSLVQVLSTSNTHQETRNKAIKELQANYGNYIGNIDLEAASVMQLKNMQVLANAEFEKKIRLAASEEILQEAYKKTASIQLKLTTAEIELSRKRVEGTSFLGQFTEREEYAYSSTDLMATAVARLKDELAESTEEYNILMSTLTDMGYKLDETTGKIVQHGDEANKVWKESGAGKEQIETTKELIGQMSKAEQYTGQFSDAMVQAIVHGQDMGEAVESALKAILVQYATNMIKQKLLSKVFMAEEVASAAIAGTAVASAWATPAALASTASFGGAAVAGMTGVATTVAGTQALAVLHEGGLIGGQGDVPIMAQSGEFVLSRTAVQSIGLDTAQRINQGQGGGITVNIMGGIVQEDYVINELLPAINKAKALA